MEEFVLEGIFKGHLVQPLAISRSIFNYNRWFRALEYFQPWEIHHPSGQLVLEFYHSHCKEFISYI